MHRPQLGTVGVFRCLQPGPLVEPAEQFLERAGCAFSAGCYGWSFDMEPNSALMESEERDKGEAIFVLKMAVALYKSQSVRLSLKADIKREDGGPLRQRRLGPNLAQRHTGIPRVGGSS